MSVTVRDCLKLPSLSLGKVIAGHKGLDSIVNTVSVLEFDDLDEDDFITPNEILITAFSFVGDDVDVQCRMLKNCKKNGDVCIVLFYSSRFLGEIDKKLIDMANLLNLPLIVLPEHDMGLKYSDVISDVMEAVFYDRRVNNYFVTNAVERLSQTPESMRSPSLALKLASDYAKASFFLCDAEMNLIASSYWPATNYIDFQIVKEALKNNGSDEFTRVDNNKTAVFRASFTDKRNGDLILCAATGNEVLSTGIMSEVVEVIQLFTALWNYNLNMSTKEAIIPALIDGSEELIKHICKSKGIEAELYNCAVFADVSESAADGEINRMVEKLRRHFAESMCPAVIDRLDTHIIVLYHNGQHVKDKVTEHEAFELIADWPHTEIYASCSAENLFDEFYLYFRRYAQTKEAIKKIYPHRKAFTAPDIRFAEKVISVVSSVDMEKEYYLGLIRPVLEEADAELIKTLSCYLLDAESDLKKTSEMLFVHKNTVLYRLNKVRTLLNCDLAQITGTYDIYMALSINRLI